MRVSTAELRACARGEQDTLRSRSFGRSDGLPAAVSTTEFNPNCCRARDGRLWFATANGIAGLDPAAVRADARPPAVFVENLLVNGTAWEDLAAFARAAHPGAPLRLAPGARTLEFHYSALSLTAPERMRFAYRLDELDADWVEAGGERSAIYRYVPPGEYLFRVKACNSDGVWNETGATLAVHVTPHFWQTGWFLGGLGLATAAGVAFMVRSMTHRRVRRRLERLERQRELERERARIAQDLHDDLGAGLTEIGLTSELVQDATLPREETRGYAQEIAARARELVAALDEIVWAVNPRNDSLPAVAAYFCQFAQHLSQPAGLRCRLDIAPALPDLPLDADQRHNLFLAFKEAIHNVVRHARAQEIRLAVAMEGRELIVRLRDDGEGFTPGPTAVGEDGLGNMRHRLRHLGGSCEVSSAPGRGTEVTFRLPLKHDAG